MLFAQKAFREYPAFEYNNFPIPPDYQEKTEWVFGRLMYPTMPGVHGRGRFGRFGMANDWRLGGRGVYWTMDYPRSDRHFSQALRRLTRIHTRSVEEPINLDDGDQIRLAVALRRRSGPLEPQRRPGAWPCANSCFAADSSCATTSTGPKSGPSSPPA